MKRMTSLYDKLPKDTRDAILCEAAAYSTMLEGMDHGAAMLREKAARLRRSDQTHEYRTVVETGEVQAL